VQPRGTVFEFSLVVRNFVCESHWSRGPQFHLRRILTFQDVLLPHNYSELWRLSDEIAAG
jgi:hypothetical protein